MHKKWTKRKDFGLTNFTHIEAAIGTPKDKMQHFQGQNATPKMQHPNQRSLPPCFFLVFLVPIVDATLCACEAIRLPACTGKAGSNSNSKCPSWWIRFVSIHASRFISSFQNLTKSEMVSIKRSIKYIKYQSLPIHYQSILRMSSLVCSCPGDQEVSKPRGTRDQLPGLGHGTHMELSNWVVIFWLLLCEVYTRAEHTYAVARRWLHGCYAVRFHLGFGLRGGYGHCSVPTRRLRSVFFCGTSFILCERSLAG